MSRTFLLRCLLPIVLLAPAWASPETPGIITVADAKRLSLPAAGSGPVTLRGTVTAFSGWNNSFFLQDSTGAISVDRHENTAVKPGDLVELTGRVHPGLFANVLITDHATVLGHGPLPSARAADFDELSGGQLDSTLIQMDATVHAVHVGSMWGRDMLFLDVRGIDSATRFSVYILDFPTGDLRYLIDSQVRVTGVCGTIFNNRKQLIGLRLFVGSLDGIQVLSSGKSMAAIPLSPLSSLLTFQGPPLNHRVHVQGTVTYQKNRGEIFLQDGFSAIRVQSSDAAALKTGTRADAWGFVTKGGYSPQLEDAVLRPAGREHPVAPLAIRAEDVFKFENGFLQAPYDSLLVELQARVVNRMPNGSAFVWILESGGAYFQAEVAGATGGWAMGLEEGANLKLKGICVAEIDGNSNFGSFHLLVASPADVSVVQAAHWNQAVLALLAIDCGVLLGGLLIFLAQRRPDTAFQVSPPNSTASLSASRRWARRLVDAAMGLAIAILLVEIYRAADPVWHSLLNDTTALVAAPTLLVAVACWLCQSKSGRLALGLGKACAWLVVIPGCLALVIGFANGAAIGLPGFLTSAVRLPPASIISLISIACAALLSNSSQLGTAQLPAVIVAFNSLLRLTGIVFGVSGAGGVIPQLSTTVPEAIALLALSIALLLIHPERGFMRSIFSPGLGGVMLRRVLPLALLTPLVLGWLRLQLQVHGLLDTRFGITIFALSQALSTSVFMCISAIFLNRLDHGRSRAQEGLRERQRKLELLFEDGLMGDYTWDVEPDRVCAHPSIWQMYGEPVPLPGEPARWFDQRQHPDDRARITEELTRVQKERRPFDLEFRVLAPGGGFRWLSCRAVASFDAEGRIVQMNGINVDITERKLAEQALRENEILFRELQDAMPQMVWQSDKRGDVTHYNRRWYEYTGQLPGQHWREIVSEKDFASISAKWIRSVLTGEPYENEVLIKRASDGAYRWHLVRAVPFYSSQGEITRWFGTCTDVHDFKRASEEIAALNATLERRVEERSAQLAQAERKFRLMVESVKDYAIYMLDREGRVASWNAGAERLKGYTAQEIIGRNFSVFYPAADIENGEPQRHLAVAAAEGQILREAQRVRKDGKQFWADVLISAIYGADGEVSGFSKVVRDVSERRRTESLLIAAQRRAEEANVAKSSFLAAMSHEIRTPMNAILGMADLLWETPLDQIQREYVGRFRRAGTNLLTLINDILDLSKIESGRFALEAIDFDLLELVDRAMEMASHAAGAKGLALAANVVPGTGAFLVGDPVRLQQVLNNLLSNAIKFTQRGSVVLEIGNHPEGQAGRLLFAVTDSGIGIPADKLGAIFEDFTQAESSTTRRFGGTGLGLGICRRLISKMGGELTVESTVGEGSTFRFDAFFGVSKSSSEPLPGALSGDLAGRPVMVVDDNATNRMIASEMCAGWGMPSRAASSAAQALALLRQARETGQSYSLILLDRLLPGTSGFNALADIKRLHKELPVIITSSDNEPGDMTEAKALGAAAYLMKPLRRAELFSTMMAVLSPRSPADPPSLPMEQVILAGRIKILLVEDAEDNRFLVNAYFAGRPYDLVTAENGLEGVQAFSRGAFDVVLMDMQMPVMDGLTATARIREWEKERAQKPATILALTANALVEDSQRSIEAGCDGHLAKPISRDKLIQAIEGFRAQAAPGSRTQAAVLGHTGAFMVEIPEGFDEHSRRYLKRQSDSLAQIRQSLAENDLEQVRGIGHKMKGAGKSYGFPNLTLLGAAIEEATQSHDLGQLHKHISELEQYLAFAEQQLEQH